MTLPVTVPFTFGNATTTQSLSSLDTNFTTITNSVNGLTNGASQINVASISATGTANATTYLRGDGVWGTPAGGGGSGTVTSINVNGGTTGLTTSGGPVTTSGNITIAGTLVAANGGTGLTSVGTSGNVLTSNGTVWVSSAGAYPLTSSTAIPSTSGTSITFSSIPSWVKRITLMFNGVSTGGTNQFQIQVGTGGSPTITGYVSQATGLASSSGATSASTVGFNTYTTVATYAWSGSFTICNVSGNIWVFSGIIGNSTTTPISSFSSGTVTLAGALDNIRIIASSTGNPADSFDAGSINILYE